MSELPRGAVTFLFTDVEGSTRLARALGDRFGEILAEHHRILRSAFAAHGGCEIDTAGDGFFVAFARAREAILAAVDAQRALAAYTWPDDALVRVRMGIHTGEAELEGGHYRGLAVHRAARICAAGHGGQVVVSQSTYGLVEDEELDGISARDLGEHLLKDFDRPTRLFQLVAAGLEAEFPAARTLDTGATARSTSGVRIQLCGRLLVTLDGERREGALPGHRGRMLFAYLTLNRARPCERDELITAVWGEEAGPGEGAALSVLLSKLRRALGPEWVSGRSEIELNLPADAFVDVEAALEAVHRAESHIAAHNWLEAYGPASIAYHVPTRPLLPGLDRPWIDEWRRRLAEVRIRGLECFSASVLGLGGPALPLAEQTATLLTQLAPYRESGYRLLMEALERRGNVAEALRTYDRLRVLLQNELGAAPGPAVQEVHRRLLGAT